MNAISHDDIFELISLDLGIEENELKKKLIDMGVERFMEFLHNKDLSLFTTPMVLKNELKDKLGSVLISKDIPLDKYLSNLFERYAADDEFYTTPFSLKPCPEVSRIYKKKTSQKMNKELERSIAQQDKYKSFYSKVFSGDVSSKSKFDNFLSGFLDEFDGINMMLKILKNVDFFAKDFAHTTNSTFLTLAIADLYIRNNGYSGNKDEFMKKIACSGFFQSPELLTGIIRNATNSNERLKQAASVAANYCGDDLVAEAVRLCKPVEEDDVILPTFSQLSNKTNIFTRILVTVNTFINLINKNNYTPESIEVHKSMLELVKGGHADKEVVELIGQLFLPDIRFALLQQAYKVQEQCPQKPIVWGISGDMLPVRLVCDKIDCQHAGQHKTFIPKDVKINADETYDTDIKAGIYYTCDLLTKRLQIFYMGLKNKEERK